MVCATSSLPVPLSLLDQDRGVGSLQFLDKAVNLIDVTACTDNDAETFFAIFLWMGGVVGSAGCVHFFNNTQKNGVDVLLQAGP